MSDVASQLTVRRISTRTVTTRWVTATNAPRRRITTRWVAIRRDPEAGFTVGELTIALMLTSILLMAMIPIVSTFYGITETVSNSYNNENQLLPMSTVFQSLLRTAVSPAPTRASGEPIPPFGTYSTANSSNNRVSAFSASTLTFFANLGDPHGPGKVVASLSGPSKNATFLVTIAHAIAGSCPGVSTPAPPATGQCGFSSPDVLIRVQHVVSPTVFTYYLNGGNGVAVANPASTFATCDSSTCNAADIESVGVDLKVNVNPAKEGEAQDETVVYELSASSQAYEPSVG